MEGRLRGLRHGNDGTVFGAVVGVPRFEGQRRRVPDLPKPLFSHRKTVDGYFQFEQRKRQKLFQGKLRSQCADRARYSPSYQPRHAQDLGDQP